MNAHRRDSREARAAVHSFEEAGEPQESAGEQPQHRDREELPKADETPPMGEGPNTSPSSGMPYQNPGEGPSTDTPDPEVAGK